MASPAKTRAAISIAQQGGQLANASATLSVRGGMGTQVNAGAVLELDMAGQTIQNRSICRASDSTTRRRAACNARSPRHGNERMDRSDHARRKQRRFGHRGQWRQRYLEPRPSGYITSTNAITTGNNLTKVGAGTLELGGTSSNSYQGNTYLNEGTMVLNKQDVGLDETQVLQLSGSSGGSVTLSFGGVSASAALPVVNEVQTLALSGTSGGSFRLSYATTPAAFDLSYQPGLAPVASSVEQALNTIPALAGNVSVSGNPGGPFDITFVGGLTGQNIPAPGTSGLQGTSTSGVTSTFGTTTAGSAPPATGGAGLPAQS